MFDLCDGENDSCKTMLLFINSSIANALNTNHNIQDPSSSMEDSERTFLKHQPQSTEVPIYGVNQIQCIQNLLHGLC